MQWTYVGIISLFHNLWNDALTRDQLATIIPHPALLIDIFQNVSFPEHKYLSQWWLQFGHFLL